MPRNGLFVVTSDPRTSPRPAEAIRIAAGVNAWQNGAIHIYLHGPAVLAISEQTGELVDEELFVHYLPVFQSNGGKLYLEKNSAFVGQMANSSFSCTKIDVAELARLAASTAWVNRF